MVKDMGLSKLKAWFINNFYPLKELGPYPTDTDDSANNSFNAMRNRWNLVHAFPVVRNWAILTFGLFIFTDMAYTLMETKNIAAIVLWLFLCIVSFLSVVMTGLFYYLWRTQGKN